MKGFHTNIEWDTLENSAFRKVLYTAKHRQLVLMSLRPKEEIGLETHPENDQFLRFEGGQGRDCSRDQKASRNRGAPAASRQRLKVIE